MANYLFISRSHKNKIIGDGICTIPEAAVVPGPIAFLRMSLRIPVK
jgi:hypothetical protein